MINRELTLGEIFGMGEIQMYEVFTELKKLDIEFLNCTSPSFDMIINENSLRKNKNP